MLKDVDKKMALGRREQRERSARDAKCIGVCALKLIWHARDARTRLRDRGARLSVLA